MVFILTHPKNADKRKFTAQILLSYSQNVHFDDKFRGELLFDKFLSIIKSSKVSQNQKIKYLLFYKNYCYLISFKIKMDFKLAQIQKSSAETKQLQQQKNILSSYFNY